MRVSWPGMLLVLFCASTAAEEQVIDVHLNDKVPAGKLPSLVVSIHHDLAALTLDLKRDDGKKVNRRLNRVPRDSQRTFELPQKSGRHRYRGTLTITFQDERQGVMNLDFVAEVVPSLGLAVSRDDLDLDLHTLLLKSRRPLTKVEYLVTGDDGSLLGRDTLKLKPGKQIKIAWKQKPGKVLKIQLIAHDTDGIFEDLELIPWSYAIPHEEVEFETGKWDIRTTEAPKLDRSYKLLKKGLAKYGKLLQVKLYIAGYTDTVAAADYNQNLSDKRALSIARHLRAKGFGHPIFYQGFGERGLKVPTPDETDEPKNRRAEYVLAAEPPPMDVPGSSSRWKRLQ